MSEKCYRKEVITCFGMPIDENPTVVVMDAAFRKMGLDYIYNGSLVYPEDLEMAVKALKALHLKGSHVTVPHKIAVMMKGTILYFAIITPLMTPITAPTSAAIAKMAR